MENTILIGDLSGIATLTQKGADSLLRTGELATFRPFAKANGDTFELYDFMRSFGIPVSGRKIDKVYEREFKNGEIKNQRTVLKHIIPAMFLQSASTASVAEVIGKKPEWKNGKQIPVILSLEEEVWCIIADWAYSSFGTLKNVSCTISLQNGVKLHKQF